MKTKLTLLPLIALLLFAPPRLGAMPADTLHVTINAYDTMKFSVTKIEAHPGQKVVVELKNEGNMPKEAMGHNWILLKAGADPVAYDDAAIKARDHDYEPPTLAHEVIASIRLLGPKESAMTSFTAPTEPGSYTFLCSFPAHYQSGMHGVLVVK